MLPGTILVQDSVYKSKNVLMHACHEEVDAIDCQRR